MKESTLQRKVIQGLRAQGCYVFKVVGGPAQQRGTPDLLICVGGRFVAIELKVPGKTAAPLQLMELQKIRNAGGRAEVFDDIENIRRFIQGLESGQEIKEEQLW